MLSTDLSLSIINGFSAEGSRENWTKHWSLICSLKTILSWGIWFGASSSVLKQDQHWRLQQQLSFHPLLLIASKADRTKLIMVWLSQIYLCDVGQNFHSSTALAHFTMNYREKKAKLAHYLQHMHIFEQPESEHVNSTGRFLSRPTGWSPEPSCWEAAALTTAPPHRLWIPQRISFILHL